MMQYVGQNLYTGAIIGVNTFIVRKGKDNLALTGLNFAVKSTTARDWIIDVVGKLPPASQVQSESKEIPPIAEVDQAQLPEGSDFKPETYIKRNKSSKKRDLDLAEQERREESYSHAPEGQPGTIFSGKKLDSLEKIKGHSQNL